MLTRRVMLSPALGSVLAALLVLTACSVPGTPWMDNHHVSPQNLPKPPDSTLSYDGQTQTGRLGSYCWQSACALMIGIPIPDEMLTVPAGASLVFAYGGVKPLTEVQAVAHLLSDGEFVPAASGRWLRPRQPGIALPAHLAGQQVALTATLPAGDYVILVRIFGPEGDASYGFHLVI